MSPPVTTPRKTRAFNTMRAKGWALCLLGMALLSSPLLPGLSAQLTAYANALRPAGWFACAAGAVLLVLHHVAQARRAKRGKAHVNPPPPPPDTRTPDTPVTLRDIRDELKRRADPNV